MTSVIQAECGEWQLMVLKESKPLGNYLLSTLVCTLCKHTECLTSLTFKEKTQTSLYIALINNGRYSHLRGPSPPALVSHAEASQALSLGHLVLPWAFVLPAGHRGRSFLLQLRQMLHTAVHLQGDTVRSIIIWSVSY